MKKIAVLGYGSIGKRHLANLRKLNCDVDWYDPAAGHTEAGRVRTVNWADAVVIASPTRSHMADIFSCENAKKPMFVEKPITDGSNSLTATWLGANIKMIGYNLRFAACVKKAREWLGKGLIGKPLWANFTCAQFNEKPDYLRDGVILNWSHEIDLALYLLGRAEVVSSTTDSSESIADIGLKHESGSLTTIHLDYVTKPEVRGFVIASDKGCIHVNIPARRATLNGINGVDEVFNGQDSFDENYLDEMRAFLMRLDGQPTLGCTAQEGLAVLDICLQAKEMAK